jgi:hypothetical protein
MVKLKTPRRSLCFFSSISKFRGAIPKVEAWLPSRPKHLDPCGLLRWHAHHCGLLPHHGYFGSRSQNTQSRSSAVRERQVEIIPICDCVTQRRRSQRPCGQGARCRHRSDRSEPPFGLLPCAWRPCAQRADEETSARLSFDDLQLVSRNRGSQ